MTKLVAVALVASALTAAGCAPYPHRTALTPEVKGSFSPAAEEQLRLASVENEERPCAGRSTEFGSTTAGTFSGGPVEKQSWFLTAGVNEFFPWALCIKQQEQWVPLFQAWAYGFANTGAYHPVKVTCTQKNSSWACHAEEDGRPVEPAGKSGGS